MSHLTPAQIGRDASERPLALDCPACGSILPVDTSAERIETCLRCRRSVRPQEVIDS